MVPAIPSLLASLAAIISLAFGFRYLFATQFMPYHAAICGRTWPEVEPGLQAILLGSFKVIGGSFIAFGLTLLWLLVPLGGHQPWAAWAVLTLTIAAVAPILYVTVNLKRRWPSARVPVIPAVVILGLGIGSASAAFFA